jgi:hypothetical protein
MATALWIKLDSDSANFSTYGIFCVAALLGAAGSTVLVSSLALTAELIGEEALIFCLLVDSWQHCSGV